MEAAIERSGKEGTTMLLENDSGRDTSYTNNNYVTDENRDSMVTDTINDGSDDKLHIIYDTEEEDNTLENEVVDENISDNGRPHRSNTSLVVQRLKPTIIGKSQNKKLTIIYN